MLASVVSMGNEFSPVLQKQTVDYFEISSVCRPTECGDVDLDKTRFNSGLHAPIFVETWAPDSVFSLSERIEIISTRLGTLGETMHLKAVLPCLAPGA